MAFFSGSRKTDFGGLVLVAGLLFLIALSGESARAAVSFSAGSAITTGATNARAVSAADVDGDGALDALSASEGDDAIRWYRNTAGDGSVWATITITTTALGAQSVHAADVDGDGDLDVLSASSGDDTIAWYENTAGDGSAWTAMDITTGALGAQSAHAADVDGDGDLDVLSASSGDDTIAWYENTAGDGSTWTSHSIDTGINHAYAVSAADVDGDGDMDALAASDWGDQVWWFDNAAGDGSLWTPHDITAMAAVIADFAQSVYPIDIDNDGDVDVTSASVDSDTISWFENTAGDGSAWAHYAISTTADGADSVVAADIDGDGDADVLSASLNDSKIAWYESKMLLEYAYAPGLVYDPDQNITWLKDANHAMTSGYAAPAGIMNWNDAVTWANNLVFVSGGLAYDDWRLPITPGTGTGAGFFEGEMAYLYTSYGITDAAPGPFLNLSSDTYWTGTQLNVPPLYPDAYYFTFVPAIAGQYSTGKTDITKNPLGWAVRIGPPLVPYALDVSVSPAGAGSITAAGIACPGDCDESYASGTLVTLTATPFGGYDFSHWTGDISSAANPVTTTMNANKNVMAVFILHATPPNQPPVLAPIGDRTGVEGNLLTFVVSASDPEGDPLSFSAAGLPAGASFGGQTFSWIPDARQAGTYLVTFTVTDGTSTVDEQITITVTNLNSPPVLVPIGNKTVFEGALLTFAVSASDPDGDPMSFSVSGLPTGASFSGQSFSWQPGFAQAGTYPVTFTVSDGVTSDSERIDITVTNVDTAPRIEPIGTVQGKEGDLMTFSVNVINVDEDPLTWEAFNLPSGASFEATNRIFSWSPALGQAGTYEVEFRVSDGLHTATTAVTLEVDISLPALPGTFPEEQVVPPPGTVAGSPEGISFSWPEGSYVETYDLLVYLDADCTIPALEVRGLTECHYQLGDPAPSITGQGLSPYRAYYWKVVAHNRHGEVSLPVIGFATGPEESGGGATPPEVIISSPQAMGGLEYQMISIPCYAKDPRPLAVLQDDLGPYVRSRWRLFHYESEDDEIHEYPDVPDMAPGTAFWIITRQGAQIDAEGLPADTNQDFVVRVPPGYFQLGCPFYFPVSWAEAKVRKGEVTVKIGDSANQWLSPLLQKYENEEYQEADMLEPWKGYWVENIGAEEVELLIPPKMGVR